MAASMTNLQQDDLVMRTDTAAGLSGPLAGANKLWLPIWSGEVIHAYDEYNMFEGLVDSKTITSGVAMEFPITGTVQLRASWDAGVELAGGDSSSQTIAVKLDKRPMAAHFEIDNIDLMQTQWEFRSELARQAGLTLANARDKQIAAYIARAGVEDLTFNTAYINSSPIVSPTTASLDPRGVTTPPVFINRLFYHLGRAGSANDDRTNAALAALQAIEDFFVYLQTINAPTEGVVLAVEPRAFQDIRALGVARANSTAATAVGYTVNMQPMFAGVAAAGGLGAPFTMGMNNLQDSLEYMGCMIIKSNHLPVADYSASAIGETRYNLKFNEAGICGLLFQRGAVASLKLQGLKVDTVDDVRRNTVFTVASMMAGTGVLRAELAAVLVKPVSQNLKSTQNDFATEVAFAATNAAKIFIDTNATPAVNNTTVVPSSFVDEAAQGGADAARARYALRLLLGSNFTREYLPTGILGGTNPTVGHPYS